MPAISRRRVALAASAAATLATIGTSPADAGLMIDLRATGGSFILDGGKSVVAFSPGDYVDVSVFARVSGTNGIHDETVQSFYGSFVSTGSLFMNAGLVNFPGGAAAFGGSASQLGSVQDIDSDGDLDIGSAGSSSTGKLFARSNAPTLAGTPIDANTGEVLVATFRVSVTGGDPYTTPTTLNFVPRTNATGGNLNIAAVWFQDADGVGYNPTVGTFTPGAPITFLGVPEPASLGLLALSFVGLLGRRHRNRGATTSAQNKGRT